jgi:hypothetical protein
LLEAEAQVRGLDAGEIADAQPWVAYDAAISVSSQLWVVIGAVVPTVTGGPWAYLGARRQWNHPGVVREVENGGQGDYGAQRRWLDGELARLASDSWPRCECGDVLPVDGDRDVWTYLGPLRIPRQVARIAAGIAQWQVDVGDCALALGGETE